MDTSGQASGAVATDYDVVVVGGAISGSSVASLVGRWCPTARILIVERREKFDRKVGEATVEVSGLFLHRVLGQFDHLSREHLPKHGLRFWFHDSVDCPLVEMSEAGPRQPPHLPSFQLSRAELDEKLLADVSGRCEVVRPARVEKVDCGWPVSRVLVGHRGSQREVTTRWLIDATGRRTLLGRQLDLIEPLDQHPTAAVWGRWTGVADLDGPAIVGSDPRAASLNGVAAARRLATNHFCGYGWWCWVIPLSSGETSIGLVYNTDLFEPPGEGSSIDRYRNFVTSQAGLRELLESAKLVENDARASSSLAYRSTRHINRGWALVGDAAGFLDPFYSPGLDLVAMSSWATARLVEDDLCGRLDETDLDERIETHNDLFLRSHRRWLQALYLGKYELFGDAELTTAAFLFDTAMYHFGVVSPSYKDLETLGLPAFGLQSRSSNLAFRIMAAFNARLNRLARFRRASGSYGERNRGWTLFAKTPGLGAAAVPMLLQGLRLWLRAERKYLWYRLTHPALDLSTPVSAPASEPLETQTSGL